MPIRIPANYSPRIYQIPFLRSMDMGKLRACLVWHRRSGKSKSLLNFTIKKAFERIGTYYHAFPTYNQGRKNVWDGIDKDSQKRFIDLHIPPEIRQGTANTTEMKIPLVNGSVYQIIGADNYDAIVGSNPVGLIMDEWAVSDRYPTAWDYFRPILAENKGWAVFPFTPRGRNHGWDLYQMALRNPLWFCQILTVDDTNAIPQVDIQAEREAGMSEDMIQQEFYCSFIASTENIVIPFRLIQQALDRDVVYNRSGRIAGFDAARFGDDRNAFVIRQAGQIIHVETWMGQDTVQSAGKVIQAYRKGFYDCVAMDVIGIGAGIYDMVNNAKVPCIAVNVSESPSDDSRFGRLRDELWWKLRQWFEDQGCSISPAIHERNRNALLSDIQDIRFEYNPKGQIKIESKEDMKERLHFSPDIGDALCCTFVPGVETKLREIDRSPFGMVEHLSHAIQEDYNPLTFGTEGEDLYQF
jgi:hypothetical protein